MSKPNSRLFDRFQEASALDPEARERFLAELENKDAALAAELRALLVEDERDGALPEDPARVGLPEAMLADALSGGSADSEQLQGEIERLSSLAPVGERYEVKEELGHGAMGRVHRAYDRALHRDLAMKRLLEEAIRAPEASGTRHGRFLTEARVTGQLDHPGIVPVHDLGVDAEGRLFFTMQRVRGRDLSEVFELVRRGEEDWSRTRAIGVLHKVCEAMAYAHSKRVVHRDLKPANIRVGRFGEVYVMDWGVARVLDRPVDKELQSPSRDLGASTVISGTLPLTMQGALVGTPHYMPPEQAHGFVDEVNERADVYAIGAMLYELLAQRRPYEETPGKDSSAEVLGRLTQGRPVAIESLAREAPPELIAICERAMAYKPSDRYSSMQDLADDLRAHLENRVVRAHRTGAVIELHKWIQRNRATAISAAAALLFLVVGTGVVAITQKLNADRERGLTAKAQTELETRKKTIELFDRLFSGPRPAVAQGEELTARQVMDSARRMLEQDLEVGSEVRGRLLVTLGITFKSLGDLPGAEQLLRNSISLLTSTVGEDDPDLLRAKSYLAFVLLELGQHEEALELRQAVYESYLDTLGPDAVDTLEQAGQLGRILRKSGRAEEGAELSEKTYRRAVEVLGDRHNVTVGLGANLIEVLALTNRLPEASELARTVLEARQAQSLGLQPKTFYAMDDLASTLADSGQYEQAEPLYLAGYEGLKHVLGEDHDHTYYPIHGLGTVCLATERYEEAEDYFSLALEKREELIGSSNWRTMRTRHFLALTCMHLEAFDQAEDLLYTNLEFVESGVADPPERCRVEMGFGELYEAQGEDELALQHYEAAVGCYEPLNDRSLSEAQESVDRLKKRIGSGPPSDGWP